MSKHDLDLCGKTCPITTVLLKRHIKALPSGEQCTVYADDSDAIVDFPGVISNMRAEYVSFTDEGHRQLYVIRKK